MRTAASEDKGAWRRRWTGIATSEKGPSKPNTDPVKSHQFFGVVVGMREVTGTRNVEDRLRFFTLLVENVTDIVGVIAPDLTMRYVSPSVQAVLGYRPNELMGTNNDDYVHPDDLGHVKVALAAALDDPGPTPFVEYRFQHKDGSWVWIQASGTNMLHDPAVNGILFVVRDVTGRKELEGELRQYKVLVENTLDMLAIINPDNTWRYVSPAFESVLGYRAEELVGSLSSDLMHPDDREHVMGSGEFDEIAQMHGPTPPIEYRYRHKDGSYRYLAVILNNLLDDPGIEGVIGSGRDVTDRKRTERLLRSLTPREMEILSLLAVGRTNREIAQQLNFSVSTVKNHVQHILARLDDSDRTQAAVRAAELGLIDQRG